MQFHSAQRSKHRLRVRRDLLLETVLRSVVRNSQAPTRVDIAEVVALLAQCANQIGYALKRLLKGTDIGDLRPDVDAYSRNFQIRLLSGLKSEGLRLGNRHAEFVLVQASRNIGMSFCRNIRIDSHRHRRTFLQSRSNLI